MKIDDDTRFPYPILSPSTGDYRSGSFNMEIAVEEVPSSAHVSINYKVILTEPGLHEAVAAGTAAVGLFVTCLDTYYSRLVPVGLADGRFAFESGDLIGRATLRPMVWARKPIPSLSLENCHPEFGGGKMSLPTGAILALDDEITISIGREKLAQMETIFSLTESPELENGRLAVLLDAERIKIVIAADIYQQLNQLRDVPVGKPIVLNSVYLPAVMEVLNTLRDDAGEYEGRRWYRVFSAKCAHLGINPESGELWHDAQRLLEMPFSKISDASNILGVQ